MARLTAPVKSAKSLARAPKVRTVWIPHNKGKCEALKAGFALSTGDIVIEQGKKIGLSDGVMAVWYIVKFNLFCNLQSSFAKLPDTQLPKTVK